MAEPDDAPLFADALDMLDEDVKRIAQSNRDARAHDREKLAEIKEIVEQQAEQGVELQRQIEELKDEIDALRSEREASAAAVSAAVRKALADEQEDLLRAQKRASVVQGVLFILVLAVTLGAATLILQAFNSLNASIEGVNSAIAGWTDAVNQTNELAAQVNEALGTTLNPVEVNAPRVPDLTAPIQAFFNALAMIIGVAGAVGLIAFLFSRLRR